jgi:lipoprotein Spr
MVKIFLPALAVTFLLSSCGAFKPLNFTSNKQVTNLVQPTATSPAKFIDEISVTATSADKTQMRTEPKIEIAERKVNIVPTPTPVAATQPVVQDEVAYILAGRKARANAEAVTVETASKVQLKYAVLMNTEVESLPNKTLLNAVDEWYGVRYRRGGNTKNGIDCSGFTEAVFLTAYGLQLPAVAREQYRICRKISTTELKEGDLVFFNTTGGVSHVGVYLGNNKFIHATVTRGVMVNDLYETYYSKRYIGAGRIDSKEIVAAD